MVSTQGAGALQAPRQFAYMLDRIKNPDLINQDLGIDNEGNPINSKAKRKAKGKAKAVTSKATAPKTVGQSRGQGGAQGQGGGRGRGRGCGSRTGPSSR
jgi:hypothetical protein